MANEPDTPTPSASQPLVVQRAILDAAEFPARVKPPPAYKAGSGSSARAAIVSTAPFVPPPSRDQTLPSHTKQFRVIDPQTNSREPSLDWRGIIASTAPFSVPPTRASHSFPSHRAM